MKRSTCIGAALASLGLAALAHASDFPKEALQLKSLTYGGTGCPSSTVAPELVLSEGGLATVKLHFRDYEAEIAGGARIARKNCAITLPFKMLEGRRLVVRSAVFQGKASLPAQGQGALGLEVFAPGAHGKPLRQPLDPGGEPLRGRVELKEQDVFVSECGGTGLIRANSSAHVGPASGRSRDAGAEAPSVRMDELKLVLATEPCDEKSGQQAGKASR